MSKIYNNCLFLFAKNLLKEKRKTKWWIYSFLYYLFFNLNGKDVNNIINIILFKNLSAKSKQTY